MFHDALARTENVTSKVERASVDSVRYHDI